MPTGNCIFKWPPKTCCKPIATAFLWLETADGTKVSCDYSVSFFEETAGQRTDYTEYIFSVGPEELSSCRVVGDFFSYGIFTEGDWSVTFPLENTE